MTPTGSAKTARHFAEGARVFHKTYGVGTILVSPYRDHAKYPKFDGGTTGTTATRVWAAADSIAKA